MNNWAVIVAAGRGTRAGLGENKVFYKVQGRSILARCLDTFSASGCFEGAVLVLAQEDMEAYRTVYREEGPFELVKKTTWGGTTRQQSVLNGLLALPEETGVVAIHDAARPFVSTEIIQETVKVAEEYGSGIISTNVTDSIKQITDDGSVVSLDRESLRAVQTPQCFDYNRILAAHLRAKDDGFTATDDAMVYEKYYRNVRLVTVENAEENRKLTTRSDFDLLKPRMPEIRVGLGYDAHRLVSGRPLMLCGVHVSFERGLEGHSDADVAIHALMDAILGAASMGDIGKMFPDNDNRYKDIDSKLLLDKVYALISENGWQIGNADITIVAQRPKLQPYIQEMRDTVARCIRADRSQISVKATTTERMGFEGEEIGISAQAVVLLIRNKPEGRGQYI